MTTITAQVYGYIRDAEYGKAIGILESKLGDFPRSRPLLSLIAYCCYNSHDYARAAEFYESLVALCPDVEEYRVNYVQSLVNCGSYFDAARVAAESPQSQRLMLLQAHAEIELGKLKEAKAILKHCVEDDPDTIIAFATLDFREGSFEQALAKFQIARQLIGHRPVLKYYIALCHQELRDYDAALRLVDEVIHGLEGEDIGSHNYQEQPTTFQQVTPVVEALNLKAAILYSTKKADEAKATLSCFQENLDSITIHNDAILNIDEDPTIGMQKLEFLLSNQPFPIQTLSNLLALYASHGQHNLAAETFEKNKHLAQELLPPDVYNYFCALTTSLGNPDSAIKMIGGLIESYVPRLKSGTRGISDAIKAATPTSSCASNRPTTAAERRAQAVATNATKEYDEILERYIPLLMLQAKLLWDRKEYDRAEQLLLKNTEFCRDHDSLRMNVGHILFQQQKFKDAIDHYEHLLKHNTELLKIPPVCLANLIAAYIMIGQNDEAEELIRKVEQEEHQQAAFSDKQTFHASTVDLVIGSLYCEKGNYVFGITRLFSSLEPFEKNLTLDTWTYAKRCFLALASATSQMKYLIKDDTSKDILDFLIDVERHGKHILIDSGNTTSDPLDPVEPVTVADEAWQLKVMFLKLRDSVY